MAVLTTQRTTCDRCGTYIETIAHGSVPRSIEDHGWVRVTTNLIRFPFDNTGEPVGLLPRVYDFCTECWPKVKTVPQSPGSITWEPHKQLQRKSDEYGKLPKPGEP